METELFYSSQDSHLVAVDCIILGFQDAGLRLLAHHRTMVPARGGLSLMGGFVKKDESVDEAAIRVLTDLTGLENIFMEQVGVYGAVDRDPGRRVISCAYYALIDINTTNQELLDHHKAFWIPLAQSVDLIFDHSQMVQDAIQILRRKAAVEPIGVNFLPQKFTLIHLQSLYEAIYDQPMDKRNFRKRMTGLGFLQKLNEVDKSGSKKGAYYYRFKTS